MAFLKVEDYQTAPLVVIRPDEVIVTATGEIDCTSTALDVRLTNAAVMGYVHTSSASDAAVSLNAANLTIGPNPEARIFGSDTAIFSANGGMIDNGGRVSANNTAIVGAGGVLKIANQGTIESVQNIAIYFNNGDPATSHLELSNSGIVKASDIAVLAGGTNDVVINTGRIESLALTALLLGGGNDLYGGSAGSIVIGKIDLGAGNDTASGGAGDEIFDGGADRDTYSYGGDVDLTIDLSVTAAQNTGQGNDRFLNFENLTGGNGNDRLAGNTAENEILGGGGNDTILGGGGNDTLRGGAGSNLLEGGIGSDTLDGSDGAGVASYQHAADAVLVNLSDESLNTGDAAGDHYVNLTGAWGSIYGDTIIGNADANGFVGDKGSDSLAGSTGNDSLHGSEGDDTLLGGADDDFMDGGEGVDTASYTGNANISIDLRLTTAQDTGQGIDTLVRIENVTSDAGADKLTGNGQNNSFTGRGGDDTLSGGGGDDTALFSGNKGDYTIVKNGNGTTTVTGPDGTDELTGIRILKFADGIDLVPNAAPDTIALSAATFAENTLPSTILATLSAHDADGDAVTYALTSNAGGIFALDGNHLILARALDYETQAQHTITVEAIDVFGAKSSQTFVLSVNDFLDTDYSLVLRGTSKANILAGASANDILYGLGGNDRLYGGAGNDKLYGGTGKDLLNGGAGHDIFVFDTKANKKTNLDKIADFFVADDTIHLAKSAFTKISKKGILAKAAFYAGSSAHDASDRLIYNKKTGALFYDQDGNGDRAQIQIATLPKKLKMSHLDFFVV
jgi:serralysin